jgi:hypothetical protein
VIAAGLLVYFLADQPSATPAPALPLPAGRPAEGSELLLAIFMGAMPSWTWPRPCTTRDSAVRRHGRASDSSARGPTLGSPLAALRGRMPDAGAGASPAAAPNDQRSRGTPIVHQVQGPPPNRAFGRPGLTRGERSPSRWSHRPRLPLGSGRSFPSRIVCGIDGSEDSADLAAFAVSIAAAAQAKIGSFM